MAPMTNDGDGRLAAPPELASPRATVTMFVFNDMAHDARVRKEAMSLAAAGYAVTLIGRQREREPLPAREQVNGFTLLRIPVPRTGRALLAGARRPWRLRRRLLGSFRAALGRPPRGWLKAVGMVVASPAVATWAAYRAADVYLLGDRAPSPGRGGPIDWLTRWQLDIKGWGELAAAAAPSSDVWHGHDFTGLPAAFAAQRRHGGKVVYDSHEIFMETTHISRMPAWTRWRLIREERDWTRRADALIAVSEGSRAELAKRYEPRRSLWVTNCPPRWGGSDGRDRLREALGLPSETPIVLYHGGFMEGRGIEQLAAAMLQPEMAGVHAVYLGYGQLRPRIEAWTRDPSYGGRVHLLEAVPIEELLSWVTTADVGLSVFQPETLNYRLTLSNKLFETIAAGVPVIASDFAQNRHVLLDDAEAPLGAVIDPDDPAALAREVRAVIDLPPAERRAARERRMRAARERWNWESESQKLLDLYADLTAPGH